MDIVQVEYGTFTHTLHLRMKLFHFIDWINFNWGHLIRRSFALLVWIGLLTKLIIYRVPPYPVRWSCRGFGFLWQAFMWNWMPWTNNYFKVSHRNQVNTPSNMKLVTSLMNSECQPYRIFEGLSYHQELGVIDPVIFIDNVELG